MKIYADCVLGIVLHAMLVICPPVKSVQSAFTMKIRCAKNVFQAVSAVFLTIFAHNAPKAIVGI